MFLVYGVHPTNMGIRAGKRQIAIEHNIQLDEIESWLYQNRLIFLNARLPSNRLDQSFRQALQEMNDYYM